MKISNIALLIFLSLLSALAYTQEKPQKVVKFTKEMKDENWYKTQAKLWEQEVAKDPSNEDSWLNLYTAYRSLWVIGNYNEEANKKVGEVIDRMEKAIPESFTYNFAKGWYLGCWNPESMKYIEKAYQLEPENSAIYNELTVRYEIAMDHEKRKLFHTKMFQKNELSYGLLNYNYNVLASLEKDAILFTTGDNDTYPAWIIQDALDFRTDVTIININLAGLDEYRNKLFKKAGIVNDINKAKSLDRPEPITGDGRKEWQKQLIKTVAENSNGKPVYIGLTMGNSEALSQVKNNLYIIGLALKYSEEKLDNLSLIRKNYEKRYLLDYVKASFNSDISKDIVNLCNQNYIAPFILLYKHYQITEELTKAEELKQLLYKIARESNKEEEVAKLLK